MIGKYIDDSADNYPRAEDAFRRALEINPPRPRLSLYAPLRWPAGTLITRPEIDQALAGTKPVEFAADVAQLEALLELITAPARTFDWPLHPTSAGCQRPTGSVGPTSTRTTTFDNSARREIC